MEDLIYHNQFGTFRGPDAEAVLRQVHAESAKGQPSSFEEWWTYNQEAWQKLQGINLPDQGQAGAAQAFLSKMVEAGALIAGPRRTVAPAAPGLSLP